MNYIQRLFDAAAPPAGHLLVPPVAATAADNVSPVLAADQRLGLFPDLVDPLVPMPDFAPAPVAEVAAAVAEPGPRPPGAGPKRAEARPSPPSAQPHRPHELVAAASRPPIASESAAGPQTLPPRPASALQRLVESAPLPPPIRRTEAPGGPTAAPVARPLPPTDIAPPSSPEPPSSGAVAAPAPASAPTPLAAPFRITPDQFQPYLPETIPPVRTSGEAPVVPPPTVPPPASPRTLEPAPHEAPSPFARIAQQPLPPALPAAAPSAAERVLPERIIERIREVPIVPPAPPKAMTAAAQSLIGSLSRRGSGRWQPRQEGL